MKKWIRILGLLIVVIIAIGIGGALKSLFGK